MPQNPARFEFHIPDEFMDSVNNLLVDRRTWFEVELNVSMPVAGGRNTYRDDELVVQFYYFPGNGSDPVWRAFKGTSMEARKVVLESFKWAMTLEPDSLFSKEMRLLIENAEVTWPVAEGA